MTDPIEKVETALNALFMDRYNSDIMVTAVRRDEESGEVVLYYPALHDGDGVRAGILTIIPESQCDTWGKAGGSYLAEIDKFLHGHTAIQTLVADDAQLERIAEMLDEMREQRALYPGLGVTNWGQRITESQQGERAR